jgi:hypothetical protein
VKVPGKPFIDKLRVIHLDEADWNLILKFFISRQLTHIAYKQTTITPEQAGGRIGRCSSDMATKAVITHEICRLQHLTGAVMYNDAKACFDRIIENMSNLCCMREGLDPKLASLHAQTLEQMKYFIKAQYGCAKTFNGHMKPDPIHGSGQGASDSIARWGFVSDSIIRAYNKKAISDPITGPISDTVYNEKIQAFVDDSHGLLIHNPQGQRTLTETIQHNMQHWESLLHAAGGKLEISKCQIVKFSPTPIEQHTDHSNITSISLSEISPSTPYKLLGVHIAFDGNNTQQAAHFQTNCDKMVIAFTRCQLTPDGALQGYRSIFLPAICYGMSATTVPEKILLQSQRTLSNAMLAKLGYNRHTPSAVAYAPEHFGGIGLYNLSVEQGIAHATFVAGHIRANTDVAKTIHILLESYMIQTGTIQNPFVDTIHISYSPAPWIDTLKNFLHESSLSITIPQLHCPKLLRLHDQPIMILAMKHYHTTQKLEAINRCRLWLQVTSIAEITTIDGT